MKPKPIRLFLSARAMMWMAALSLALSGCATSYTDYDAFIHTPRPIVGGKPYVIEPPDVIRIVSPNAPELHASTVQLRPDGYITLYLLGDLFAAGKTPAQLAAELEEKVLKYYQDATVQVQVVGFNSKVYYMAGETDAGPKPYTGRDTILDAVLGSGIPRTAWPEKLIVLRPDEHGGVTRRMTVNFKQMIKRGELDYNAVLEEGDIIYMPTHPLATLGIAVQNLISPVGPVLSAASVPARAAAVGTVGAN